MKSLAAPGVTVTHPDRDDDGTVVDSDAAAWTPDDLTYTAPHAGMVKVRWSGSADPTEVFWEYIRELTRETD